MMVPASTLTTTARILLSEPELVLLSEIDRVSVLSQALVGCMRSSASVSRFCTATR